MRNKSLLLLTLAAAILGCAANPVFGQRTARKPKDKIPESVLDTPYSEAYVEDKFKTFREWTDSRFPESLEKDSAIRNHRLKELEKERQKAEKVKAGKGRDKKPAQPEAEPVQERCLTVSAFRNAILPIKRFVSSKEAMDDLEEVMEYPRAWYLYYFKAVLRLEEHIKLLERARTMGDEDLFRAETLAFKRDAAACKKIWEDKPKKMGASPLKELRDANRKRRAQIYRQQQTENKK